MGGTATHADGGLDGTTSPGERARCADVLRCVVPSVCPVFLSRPLVPHMAVSLQAFLQLPNLPHPTPTTTPLLRTAGPTPAPAHTVHPQPTFSTAAATATPTCPIPAPTLPPPQPLTSRRYLNARQSAGWSVKPTRSVGRRSYSFMERARISHICVGTCGVRAGVGVGGWKGVQQCKGAGVRGVRASDWPS